MSIEAMKQALEALEGIYIAPENLDYIADWWPACRDSIPALRQAIAEAEKQEQGEPVAEIKGFDGRGAVLRWFIKSTDFPAGTTFYTTPQQRTWVGLTDEEVTDFHIRLTMPKLQIKAIEAKLKEKNT